MNKFLYILVLLFVCVNTFAQNHLSFNGVPIEGTVVTFVDALKTKGFVSDDKVSNDLGTSLFGQYNGENVLVFVFSDESGTVNKVLAFCRPYNDWGLLKTSYLQQKENMLNIYGEAAGEESFVYPFEDGAGNELEALRTGKAVWRSEFDREEGQIILSIQATHFGQAAVCLEFVHK